jgi:hypothetical protein
MVPFMMKLGMYDTRSMSPAFFLSLLLHAVILCLLLVTIAYQKHQQVRRRAVPPVNLRQQQIPHVQPQPATAPPASAVSATLPSDQKTVTAPESVEPIQPPKIAEKMILPAETTSESMSSAKSEQQQKNADRAPSQQHSESHVPATPEQSAQAQQKRSHAWRKHYPFSDVSQAASSSHTPSPTLAQLLNAGVESLKQIEAQEHVQGEKNAITKSFEKDAYAAYLQDVLYAIRFALNRQRIKVAPINTPSRIQCKITLSRDGRITASELLSAHVINDAMKRYVDEVIAATRFAGPVRPFPSCITTTTLPLTIFIVNDDIEHNPHLMNTPRVITFRIYNPRS